MSILNLFSKNSDSTIPEGVVKRAMQWEYRDNIQGAIQAANEWKPRLTWGSYDQEIYTRFKYLQGSMQEDMKTVLQRRFPKTHKELWQEQLNLRLYRRMVLNKSKVFSGQGGRAYLVDDDGQEIDPESNDAANFDELMTSGGLWRSLIEADRCVQGLERACVKLWFDSSSGAVKADVWAPNQVYVVPTLERYWDVDAAKAVLFRLPGESGYSGIGERWEVWCKGGPLGQESLHYIAGSKPVQSRGRAEMEWYETKINDNDEIPFKDADGAPVYPFEWWQSDTVRDIYGLSNEDSLTVNRMLNAQLTDLNNAIHLQAFPLAVISLAPGTEYKGGLKVYSPGEVFELPPGATMDYKNPGLDVTQVQEFLEKLTQLEALVDGQNAASVRVQSDAPDNASALQIRNVPLVEHRREMWQVEYPHAVSTLERAICVWNTYRVDKPISTNLHVALVPGELDIPQDDEVRVRMWQIKFESNVATPVDMLMEEEDISREEALQRIKDNAALNKEIKALGRSDFVPFGMASPPPGQDEPEPEDEPESEEQPEDKEE